MAADYGGLDYKVTVVTGLQLCSSSIWLVIKKLNFIAIIEKQSAKGIIGLFRDNVQRLHRLSESIILDRGP